MKYRSEIYIERREKTPCYVCNKVSALVVFSDYYADQPSKSICKNCLNQGIDILKNYGGGYE